MTDIQDLTGRSGVCHDALLYLYIFSFLDEENYTMTVMSFARTCKTFHHIVCEQGVAWENHSLTFDPLKINWDTKKQQPNTVMNPIVTSTPSIFLARSNKLGQANVLSDTVTSTCCSCSYTETEDVMMDDGDENDVIEKHRLGCVSERRAKKNPLIVCHNKNNNNKNNNNNKGHPYTKPLTFFHRSRMHHQNQSSSKDHHNTIDAHPLFSQELGGLGTQLIDYLIQALNSYMKIVSVHSGVKPFRLKNVRFVKDESNRFPFVDVLSKQKRLKNERSALLDDEHHRPGLSERDSWVRRRQEEDESAVSLESVNSYPPVGRVSMRTENIISHLLSRVQSLELSSIELCWTDLYRILSETITIKHLIIKDVTLLSEAGDSDIRRMTRTLITMPFLVHLELNEKVHDIVFSLNCPAIVSLKLTCFGRGMVRIVPNVTHVADILPGVFDNLREISFNNCNTDLVGRVLGFAMKLECLVLNNMVLPTEATQWTNDCVNHLSIGLLSDDVTYKELIDKLKTMFPNLKQLHFYDSILANCSSNMENSKAYSIRNLDNIQLVTPLNDEKLHLDRIVMHSSRIPAVLRKCWENELEQLILCKEFEYIGRGSGMKYTCADSILVNIIDTEIHGKKSFVILTPELHQALILCTGYCQKEDGNTRARLKELWSYLLRHSFDPVGIREFGLGKLLTKTRHIRELHFAMTNQNTSSGIVVQFEKEYSIIANYMEFYISQDPSPQFSFHIQQLESCARVMKSDIEKVNIGNLDVLLDKDQWVNDSVVEDYEQISDQLLCYEDCSDMCDVVSMSSDS